MAEFVYQVERKTLIPNNWAAEFKVPKDGDWVADEDGDLYRIEHSVDEERKYIVVWRIDETPRQMRIREKVESMLACCKSVGRTSLTRRDLDAGHDWIMDLVRQIEAEFCEKPKSESDFFFSSGTISGFGKGD